MAMSCRPFRTSTNLILPGLTSMHIRILIIRRAYRALIFLTKPLYEYIYQLVDSKYGSEIMSIPKSYKSCSKTIEQALWLDKKSG